MARVLSFIGAVDCYILDIDPTRQQAARNMGFQVISPGQAIHNFDIAFNSSSSAAGLQQAIDAVGQAGKVVELSWYGSKSVNVLLGGSFHSQPKQLISSQVSALPPDRLPRWDFARRKKVVFQLLQNPVFDHMISLTLPFAEAPIFFKKIRTAPISAIGVCIDYR